MPMQINQLTPDASTDALRSRGFAATVGLVVKRGGGEAVFGSQPERVFDAWNKSMIGHAYPSFWLEVPLLGEPGFDLHVYYNRGQVAVGERFDDGCGFGCQELFDWYFAHETGGVGVGFAHDVRGASLATGAYVNFNSAPLDDLTGFFASLHADQVASGMQELIARVPALWRPWYVGVFVGRAGSPSRLGCFVDKDAQHVYAADATRMSADLHRAGFTAVDHTMLTRVQHLAAEPFQLELQLDLEQGTTVGDTLGVDLTIAAQTANRCRELFTEGAAGAHACKLLESWGMADGRWRELSGCISSKLVPLARNEEGGIALLINCAPAFIKAKWCNGEPQAAKVYLQCSSSLVQFS